MKHKVTILTSFGAALEYYDFVIYIVLAHYISQAFFPATDSSVALLETLAVFALGYLVRPLGGMIFGSLGDRFGRKKIFVSTLLIMAIATLSIGLLPTYQQIGISATFLLIMLRILQGLALGAEIPGAITFLTEHVQAKDRGLQASLMFLGISLGAMLSTLVNYILTSIYEPQQMQDFAWRIPFLIGGVLAIVSFYIRRNTVETPYFIEKNTVKTPLTTLFKTQPINLLRGICFVMLPAGLVMFYLFLPTYASTYYNYPLQQIYLYTTIGLFWTILTLPFFGWLSDRISRTRLLAIAAALVIILLYMLFKLLSQQSALALLSFVLIYQTLISMMTACYPSMLSELFSTAVRYSGVAICYNVAYSLAGLTPLMIGVILTWSDNPLSASYLLIVYAIIALISSLISHDYTGKELP